MKSLLFTIIILAGISCHSQLVVSSDQTVAYYIQEVLLGDGVEVSNITFNESAAGMIRDQVGYFDSNNANVGIPTGLIMATGQVYVAQGPNNAAGNAIFPSEPLINGDDEDLLQIMNGVPINDWAIIEFDFIPSGDSISLDYIFASEEYLEFVNLGFSDSFGFFLSGPGINGPFTNNAVNIATIPGTEIPVAVDNLNAFVFPEYYVDNGDGLLPPMSTDPFYIQFDGFTVPLTATSPVTCGAVYHIKLAIADANDSGVDSAVFLSEGSFASSTQVNVSLITGNGQEPLTAIEQCGSAHLLFERGAAGDINLPLNIELNYGGTAVSAVDYEALPEHVIIPAGEMSVQIPVIALDDDLIEGTETVSLTIISNTTCSNNSDEFTFFISDAIPMNEVLLPDGPITLGCDSVLLLQAEFLGGQGPLLWEWTNDLGEIISQNPWNMEFDPTIWGETSVQLSVTDLCTNNSTDVVEITVDTPEVLVYLGPDLEGPCTNEYVIIPEINGGSGPFQVQWEVSGSFVSDDLQLTLQSFEDTEVTITLSDACGMTDSDTLMIRLNNIPLEVSLGPDSVLCNPQTVDLMAAIQGGHEPIELAWSNGATANNISLNITDNLDISIIATDACNQNAEDAINFIINESMVNISTTQLDDYRFLLEADLDPICPSDECSIFWELPDGSIAEGYSIEYQFKGTANEEVRVSVIDSYGCTRTAEWWYIPNSTLYVPNSFTPNGDGTNDVFISKGGPFLHFEMQIYSKWGEMVFSTTDPTLAWTGNIDGKSHYGADGVYFYRISAKTPQNGIIEQTGHVLLIR